MVEPRPDTGGRRTGDRPTDDRIADVCVVTTIHPAFDGRIYARSLCTLAAGGLRVSFLGPWAEPPDAPTVRWTTGPLPASRWARIANGFRTFRRCMAEPARAFHFHDLDFLPWAVLLRVARRVRVVYDCHENYPEEIAYAKPYVPPWARAPLAGAVRILEDWAVRRLGWVVVAAPSQASRFRRLGVRCLVSRNLSAAKPMPGLRHQRGVACIGTLGPTYGVWVLLDIARELERRGAGVPMLVADRFISDDVRTDFLRACAAEGLDVTVHPRVAPAELPELLASASVGLSVEQDSPEKRMALPSKLFDYMAMGLPVVASDLPNTRAVVEQAGCGLLVAPGDAAAYVEAVMHILDDPAAYARYRDRGFRAMATHFSWEREAAGLVAFFREALA